MSELSVLEILKSARELISDEGRWYRAPLDSASGKVGRGATARRCMGAAICDAGAPWPDREDVWSCIHEQVGAEVAEFNFNHTHAEVIAAFDEAIRRELEAPHV